MIIWITGLSASGKTTLGMELYKLLKHRGNWLLLDGDTIRTVFGEDLGHTVEDRMKNGYRMSRLCKLMELQNINVIACVLVIRQELRDYNRNTFTNYKEIFIDVDIDNLIKRDNKGIYKMALSKKICNVAGIDIAIDKPLDADYFFINNNDGIDFTEKSIEICNLFKIDLESSYFYTNRNLLDFPEKYEYTNYSGSKFFVDYRNNRLNILKKISNFIHGYSQELLLHNYLHMHFNSSNTSSTKKILKIFYESISLKEFEPKILLFLKKFEVSKKIYQEYDVNTFTKITNEHKDIDNYLLFAYILIHSYDLAANKQIKLILFNSLLKLNDILISSIEMISNDGQYTMLKQSIEKEISLYEALRGIDI